MKITIELSNEVLNKFQDATGLIIRDNDEAVEAIKFAIEKTCRIKEDEILKCVKKLEEINDELYNKGCHSESLISLIMEASINDIKNSLQK